MRSPRILGRRPARCCAFRNRTPIGLSIVPASLRVVKHMFFSIIIEGYMEEKSRAITHSYSPGSRVWTYPPSMDFPPEPARVIGTATPSRSAARMRIESIIVDVRLLNVSATGSFETTPRSIALSRRATFSRTRGASSASFLQYSRTFSRFRAHSSSMWTRSTSCFPSPRSHRATASSVSCFGLSSSFTAHQASAMLRADDEFRRVPTRRGRPEDPDARGDVLVVDEPMRERDVRRHHLGPVLPGPLPVLRRLPGVLEGDLRARGLPSLDLELDGIHLQDLGVPLEVIQEDLGRADRVEVRLEAPVLRDDGPSARPPRCTAARPWTHGSRGRTRSCSIPRAARGRASPGRGSGTWRHPARTR